MADQKRFEAQSQDVPTGGEGKDYKHLVRVMNTDLKGNRKILYALPYIKGIGLIFANAVLRKANVDIHKKAGYLTEAEVKAIEEVITHPVKHGIPIWMFDRRKDYDTGADIHIISGTLQFTQEMDVKRMKKTKSYKGLRHQWGQPVRGQRTKSNFRKNKGKVSLGVVKKKISGKV
ncbi:30S ribosomal protein S13 [Candidatus Woesearchaeota archaeon]|nr:30S ribosomal protein S13 [Candidatus Woesearchaeota archaeon]